MSYTYDWPQASPCSNIILYTRNGDEVTLLITERDQSVGTGKSLSAGGFDEVKDAFGRAGEMIDGIAETYREMHEELGDEVKRIIPYEDFKKRVEYLWDGLIPNKKHPLVEKVVMRALEITEAQMDAIMKLPPTTEQKGKMLKTFSLYDEQGALADNQIIEQALTGFKYRHEVEGAKMWFDKMKQSAPSAGPGW